MKDLYSMPLFKQGLKTAYCVPYSMLGIARYFEVPVTRLEMVKACKTHKKQGTQDVDCSRGIQKFGLKFRRLKFSYRNIRRFLNQSLPVVISYRVSPEECHFSTIIDAYQDSRGVTFYTLNDTYYERYAIPGEVLNYLMRQSRSWARVVERTNSVRRAT